MCVFSFDSSKGYKVQLFKFRFTLKEYTYSILIQHKLFKNIHNFVCMYGNIVLYLSLKYYEVITVLVLQQTFFKVFYK